MAPNQPHHAQKPPRRPALKRTRPRMGAPAEHHLARRSLTPGAPVDAAVASAVESPRPAEDKV